MSLIQVSRQYPSEPVRDAVTQTAGEMENLRQLTTTNSDSDGQSVEKQRTTTAGSPGY
jgi:hypothetical protein